MAENLNSRGLRFWTRVVRFRWSLWCSRRWWLDWSTFSNNSPLLLSSPRLPPEALAGYLHETSFGSPEHDQKSHKSLIEPQAKLQFSSSSNTPKSLPSSPLLVLFVWLPQKAAAAAVSAAAPVRLVVVRFADAVAAADSAAAATCCWFWRRRTLTLTQTQEIDLVMFVWSPQTQF